MWEAGCNISFIIISPFRATLSVQLSSEEEYLILYHGRVTDPRPVDKRVCPALILLLTDVWHSSSNLLSRILDFSVSKSRTFDWMIFKVSPGTSTTCYLPPTEWKHFGFCGLCVSRLSPPRTVVPVTVHVQVPNGSIRSLSCRAHGGTFLGWTQIRL